MERVTLADERVIARQLARPPRGLCAIARRCSSGYPQVVQVRPLIEGEPFPTLYWLTCPHLRREVDRLEAEGWVGRLEARLAEDEVLASRYEHARRSYVRDRLERLSEPDRRYLEERNMLESLTDKGIGGIDDRRRLKCLHLHVAHALADRNPIGEIVLEMLERGECLPTEVICSTR